jgi:hypothetical protein
MRMNLIDETELFIACAFVFGSDDATMRNGRAQWANARKSATSMHAGRCNTRGISRTSAIRLMQCPCAPLRRNVSIVVSVGSTLAVTDGTATAMND